MPIRLADSIIVGAYSLIVFIVSLLAGPDTDNAAASLPVLSNIGADKAAAPVSRSSKLVA
ncbi:hypothetical protein D3C77_810130 [compost metagenome]